MRPHVERVPGGWQMVDLDQYDGAPDAAPQLVGYGDTMAEAVDDFWAKVSEREEEL